jgi:serine/threonine protein kinase
VADEAGGSNRARGPRGPHGFEILGLLGEGASGVVLLAKRDDGGLVAVKRLAGDWFSEAALSRFRREARIVDRLEHAHIVHSLGHVVDGDDAWILMEYIDGPNLDGVLRASPLSTANALAVLSSLADALSYAHGQGVLHRDIAPANVLFTKAGLPMLADFGMAKIIGRERATSLLTFRTHTGALIGTPAYMSPEAAEGVAELTARSDIYSLGVLAYRMLVGRLPFPFDGNVLATLEAHISEPVPPPTDQGVTLPPALEIAMLRALAKDPADRQSGAAEFWAEFAEAASDAWPRWKELVDLESAVSRVSSSLAVDGDMKETLDDVGVGSAGTIVRDVRRGSFPASPLSTTRIAAPVFVPKARRRWPGFVASAILGVGIAIGLFALTGVLTSSSSIAVDSVSVTVSQLHDGHGLCPETFVLTGRIVTNGRAGHLRYEWFLPGERPSAPHERSLESGEAALDVTTSVTAARNGLTSAKAALRVLDPSPPSSTAASLSLRCP